MTYLRGWVLRALGWRRIFLALPFFRQPNNSGQSQNKYSKECQNQDSQAICVVYLCVEVLSWFYIFFCLPQIEQSWISPCLASHVNL